MIGVVLAAGPGRRLGALTEALPKTLLRVDGEGTILDLALSNLRAAGIERVVVVTGFADERIAERVPELQDRHDVMVELLHNDHALEWNNAYSLWLARDALAEGAILVNGDTVHPRSVQGALLDGRDGGDLVLAVDREKVLGEEEMKVLLDGDGHMAQINKALDPTRAHGEYIGVTLVEPHAAGPLGDALEATWRRDPSLYYEDGFQELADRGGTVTTAPIGAVDWVEVDNDADLARAREIACRF
jgi:choline kinase